VSGITNTVSHTTRALPRRTARREATRREILDAAWAMVREHGLNGLSLRALGERVGMRAQSLYSYFASKDEIHDALFRDGNEQFAEWMAPVLDRPAEEVRADPHGTALASVRRHFEFCVADPVRYELLFQRTLPGFTPSPESYVVAVSVLEKAAAQLAVIGVDEPDALDLWTAVTTGLTNQQIANDPTGDRWERLLDRAVRMLLAECAPHLDEDDRRPTRPTPRRTR
jgi:AcrR family transcriptional regulator